MARERAIFDQQEAALAHELFVELCPALRSAAAASFHQVRDGLPRALTERRA